MSEALVCRNLKSGYGDTVVLPQLELALDTQDIYALMGKNGAGKSTLFLTLLGVLAPMAGTIRLFDQETAGWPPFRLAAIGVACAPQENAFFQDLTVEENLRLGSLSLTRVAFARGRERVIDMFPFVGDRLSQKAGTLSGGEQAMLKVARALLPEPRIVLLDEVTEGLQPMTVDRVRDVLVADHRERGTTMLVIEQNVDFVARFANRFGLIDRGQIVGEGRFSDTDAISRIERQLSV
jgi:ABC-type branched-subunit amino acid transport system ATPase component